MKTIEKIIFDRLASGSGIELPEVGELRVEREAARFRNDTEIIPPHFRVIFDQDGKNTEKPLIDLISERKGIDAASASEQYMQWLGTARKEENIVEINDVGVINDGIFYPSIGLYEALNCGNTENVTVKKRSSAWKNVFIGLGVGGAAAIVLLLVMVLDRRISSEAEENYGVEYAMETLRREKEAEETGESVIAAIVPADTEEITDISRGSSPSADVEDIILQELENYAKASSVDTEPATTSAPQNNVAGNSPVYYLVAGVFSEPANADKMIKEDRLGIGSGNYMKVDFKDGKTLVSPYSSNNRQDVERRRKQLGGSNSEMWIYTKE